MASFDLSTHVKLDVRPLAIVLDDPYKLSFLDCDERVWLNLVPGRSLVSSGLAGPDYVSVMGGRHDSFTVTRVGEYMSNKPRKKAEDERRTKVVSDTLKGNTNGKW